MELVFDWLKKICNSIKKYFLDEKINMTDSNIPIVDVGYSLMSMREAPYTTESALAELIDNSLQAHAKNIALLAKDELRTNASGNQIHRLEKLGIFDDGDGMDEELLQKCLSVGFSRNKEDPNGMGKFGFGMLIGSLSQCFRVEVYSWQEKGKIFHTYIDIRELIENNTTNIPKITTVKEKDIPILGRLELEKNDYLKSSKSGTFVVLDKLDSNKVKYTTQAGIFGLISNDLGRIYRHFLDDDDTYGEKKNIEVIGLDPLFNVKQRDTLLANDPMYLLTPNNLPDFEGENLSGSQTNKLLNEKEVSIEYTVFNEMGEDTGETAFSDVVIRSSVVKPEFRAKLNRGNATAGGTAPGKHYADNQGVSVVRAEREIKLDSFGFLLNSEVTERWWGLELRFNRELDGIFGLSNDKQHVKNFTSLKKVRQAWHKDKENDLIKIALEKINNEIEAQLKEARKLVELSAGKRSSTSTKKISLTEAVNEEVSRDKTPTHSALEAESTNKEEKIQEIKTFYEERGLSPEAALEKAELEVEFVINLEKDEWPGSTFLDFKNMGSGAAGILNIKHPFYKIFYKYLEEQGNPKAMQAMRIILMAFIRTEDELKFEFDKDSIIFNKFRDRWGHWVNELISMSDE